MRACVMLAVAAGLACGGIKIKKEGERKRAPLFELAGADGRPVRLEDYSGRVVLIDFWATWCGPCQAAMPWMVELAEKYRERGLTVIGVSMDAEGWGVVKPFLEKHKVKHPVVLGNPRVAYLYGDVEELPVAFFVDRKGRVAAIHLGRAKREEFEKTVVGLLEGGR